MAGAQVGWQNAMTTQLSRIDGQSALLSIAVQQGDALLPSNNYQRSTVEDQPLLKRGEGSKFSVEMKTRQQVLVENDSDDSGHE